MGDRKTRYQVNILRSDGSTDIISYFSRRADAIKRAAYVAVDRTGWSKVISVWVHDTRPALIEGRFVGIIFQSNREG